MGELLRNLAIQPNKGNRESEKNSQDEEGSLGDNTGEQSSFQQLLDSEDLVTKKPDRIFSVTVIAKVPCGYLVDSDLLGKPALLSTSSPDLDSELERDISHQSIPHIKHLSTLSIGDTYDVFVVDANGINPDDNDDPIMIVAIDERHMRLKEQKNRFELLSPTIHFGDEVTGTIRNIHVQSDNVFVILDNGLEGILYHNATTLWTLLKGQTGDDTIQKELEELIGERVRLYVKGRNNTYSDLILSIFPLKDTQAAYSALRDHLESLRLSEDPKDRKCFVQAIVKEIKPEGLVCDFNLNGIRYTGFLPEYKMKHIPKNKDDRAISPGDLLVVSIKELTKRNIIYLSVERDTSDLWGDTSILELIKDQEFEAEIIKVFNYGVKCEFRLPDCRALIGLVHESQFPDTGDFNASSLTLGTKIAVNILKIDHLRKKIGLTMRVHENE